MDIQQNEEKTADLNEVVRDLLDHAAVEDQSLSFERRKILIAELKKYDRPLLASSKAHGP